MSAVFSDFMDDIRRLDRPEHLRTAMADFVQGLGFEFFMFLHFDESQGQSLILANYPEEWQTRYLARNYATVDPVAAQGMRSTTAFTWGETEYLARLNVVQRNFMSEAGEFGLKRGLCSIWAKGKGKLSGVSATSCLPEAEFKRLLARNRADLELASLYFCSHVENRVVGRIQRHYHDLLTEREKDLLLWTLQGRNVEEMAATTALTVGQVFTALAAVACKLSTPDPAHAAAKAVELGLIAP